MPKKYVVEAKVCDVIRSVPLDRGQANQLKRHTRSKLGSKANVKVKKA